MKITRILLFIIIITGITLAIIYREQFDITTLQTWVTGDYAVVLFMSIYSIATVFFLPGSIFTLAGGALFGPLWGTFYSLTAATLGAILSFLAARYIASDWVTKKVGGRLKQLLDGVEDEGWGFVAFVRLVPLFPFNVLNYALGLTRIKLFDYSLTGVAEI